jgi:GNAT superfamily N-acetyltransferase
LWDIFRKYHYLNTELHNAAAQYIGILNGEAIVCHTGVIQAALKRGTKRVHRLVTLPSFQGIGIGLKFINFIADLYDKEGLNFNLITTTPALRYALCKCDKWHLKRSEYVTKAGNGDKLEENFKLGHLNRTFSYNRETYSFDWVKKYPFIDKRDGGREEKIQELSLF